MLNEATNRAYACGARDPGRCTVNTSCVSYQSHYLTTYLLVLTIAAAMLFIFDY